MQLLDRLRREEVEDGDQIAERLQLEEGGSRPLACAIRVLFQLLVLHHCTSDPLEV